MNDIYLRLVELFIIVVVTIITRNVIPYLKSKVGENNLKEIESWVSYFVKSAEMIFGSNTGEEKLNYVMEEMTDKLNKLGIVLTEIELRALVEQAVYTYTKVKK